MDTKSTKQQCAFAEAAYSAVVKQDALKLKAACRYRLCLLQVLQNFRCGGSFQSSRI
jgi:hypothetical protein